MEFYQHKASPKLGLTPLIDVVFILLLFFMLASNFNRWQETAIASVNSGANSVAPIAEVVALFLYPDGRLQHDDSQPFDVHDWAWLATILADNAETSFTIVPLESDIGTSKVSVQTLINTIDNLQQRGVTKLTFRQKP